MTRIKLLCVYEANRSIDDKWSWILHSSVPLGYKSVVFANITQNIRKQNADINLTNNEDFENH